MKTLFPFKRTFIKGILVITLLLWVCIPLYGQTMLSDDELIDRAYAAYGANDCVDASLYLYAYLQRKPAALASDPDAAKALTDCCKAAFSNLSTYLTPAHPAINNQITLLSSLQLLRNYTSAYSNKDYGNACVSLFAYMYYSGNAGKAIDLQKWNLSNTLRNDLYACRYNYIQQQKKAKDVISDADDGSSVQSSLSSSLPPLPAKAKLLYMRRNATFANPAIQETKAFNDFPDAFAAVFNQAAVDFINFRGEPFPNSDENYKTTITISNPVIVPANIYKRNNLWSFRFTINGSSVNEEAQYNMICANIEQALANNGLSLQKTPIDYKNGTVTLTSFEYTAPGYLFLIYRANFGDTFSDDVIITHIPN